MLINKIDIVCIRALKSAPITFKPGMNLIVGVNGVGKTTVLDTIRTALSNILPEISAYKGLRSSFSKSDISIGSDGLQVSLNFTLSGQAFNLLIVKQQERTKAELTGGLRDQTFETPDIVTLTPDITATGKLLKAADSQPLVLFFSTRRSLMVNQLPTKASAAGGQAAAFAEALSDKKEFNIRLFAQWFKVQQQLSEENPAALRHLAAITKAIKNFLPEFDNLHVADIEEVPGFVIEKNGIPLYLWQLSDGERGVLSLVMDIARRLSQANPGLQDPITQGMAVILIDELDLHLHPKWQRVIVDNLTTTFPNCQFIASTHSPQIIPSLDPEHVILIKDNQVMIPERTKGMDSNWILRHLMEAHVRPTEASEAVAAVEDLILEGDFTSARDCMAAFRSQGLDLQDWTMLEARIARLEVIGDGE